jgi:hypothetical protein
MNEKWGSITAFAVKTILALLLNFFTGFILTGMIPYALFMLFYGVLNADAFIGARFEESVFLTKAVDMVFFAISIIALVWFIIFSIVEGVDDHGFLVFFPLCLTMFYFALTFLVNRKLRKKTSAP